MKYQDFFGNDLKIGDVIAFHHKKHRGLCLGTIIKITPTMVHFEWGGYMAIKEKRNHKEVIIK